MNFSWIARFWAQFQIELDWANFIHRWSYKRLYIYYVRGRGEWVVSKFLTLADGGWLVVLNLLLHQLCLGCASSHHPTGHCYSKAAIHPYFLLRLYQASPPSAASHHLRSAPDFLRRLKYAFFYKSGDLLQICWWLNSQIWWGWQNFWSQPPGLWKKAYFSRHK